MICNTECIFSFDSTKLVLILSSQSTKLGIFLLALLWLFYYSLTLQINCIVNTEYVTKIKVVVYSVISPFFF